MIDPLQRITLFALYQLALIIGIVLMPLALVAQRGGLQLPIHRIVERIGEKYQKA